MIQLHECLLGFNGRETYISMTPGRDSVHLETEEMRPGWSGDKRECAQVTISKKLASRLHAELGKLLLTWTDEFIQLHEFLPGFHWRETNVAMTPGRDSVYLETEEMRPGQNGDTREYAEVMLSKELASRLYAELGKLLLAWAHE